MDYYKVIAPTRKEAIKVARREALDRSGSKLEKMQARFFQESILKGECNCGQCEYVMCIFTPVRKPAQVVSVRWCRWCGKQTKEEELPEQGIEPILVKELIEAEPPEEPEQAFPDMLQPTQEDIFQALERKLLG